MVDLRRIFLAAQVVPDLLGQFRRVSQVPSLIECYLKVGGGADEGLHFLPVAGHATIRAPERYLRIHPAIRLIAPFGGNLPGQAAGKIECGIDFVLDVAREDLVEHGTADGLGWPDEKVHDIDRMAGVVVEAAAAFVLAGTPGRSLRTENDRSVGLGANVMNFAEYAGIDQPLVFLEGPDKAKVGTDLIDQTLFTSQHRELSALRRIKTEGFLAKDMEVLVQGGTHHLAVKTRRRRD